MFKIFKATVLLLLLAILASLPFILSEPKQKAHLEPKQNKPEIALVFYGLGANTRDLYRISQLRLAAAIAITAGLRFSKNVAHIGTRSGFTVLLHLPLEPEENLKLPRRYDFTASYLNQNQAGRLLNNYLNSIRPASGVATYLKPKKNKNPKLLPLVFDQIKERGFLFIETRCTPESTAYKTALAKNIPSAYATYFLNRQNIKQAKDKLIDLAKSDSDKSFIIIVEPKKEIFQFFQSNLTWLKENFNFITLEQYFNAKNL